MKPQKAQVAGELSVWNWGETVRSEAPGLCGAGKKGCYFLPDYLKPWEIERDLPDLEGQAHSLTMLKYRGDLSKQRGT